MKFAAFVAASLVSTAALAEPLTVHDGRLFVPAVINGVAVEGLLDSGAEMTVVDSAFAATAKVGRGAEVEARGTGKGTQKAQIVEGVTLDALGTRLDKVSVVVMDLTEVSARLIKRPTRLILGRDLFDARRLRIDLGRGDIHALASDDAPTGVKLPLTPAEGIEAVPVTAGGMAAIAILDFGNGSEPTVSRPMVTALKLQPAGTRVGGGIGGAHERQLVRLPSLVVAGKRFTNLVASVDEKPATMQMNIGTSILRHFVVTTDFAGRAAWFDAASVTAATGPARAKGKAK